MDISGINNNGSQISSDIYNNVNIKPVETKVNASEVQGNVHKDVEERVKENVESLNQALINQDAKYIIERHKVFGDTMVKIVNKNTKETLLEIPPEKFLDMIAKLCEIVGLKIDEKA